MRKQSMIGGGEFEFEPHKLDLKVEKRKEYLDKSEKFFINELNRQMKRIESLKSKEFEK